MADCGCELEVESPTQARVLWVVLGINAAMFVAEFSVGVVAESTALVRYRIIAHAVEHNLLVCVIATYSVVFPGKMQPLEESVKTKRFNQIVVPGDERDSCPIVCVRTVRRT